MDGLRIGIIGAGNIAHNHADATCGIPGIELCCIADIAFERAEVLGKKYNIKPYGDYREMMDREKPDAVVITLPVFLHCEAVEEAASRKIHVLVEKPMAATTGECGRMIEAAERNNVRLMVGHMQRFIAVNRRAVQITEESGIGKLIMVNEKRYYDYFTQSRPGWCLKKETAGGGVLMNLGAHSLDKVLFMSGSRIKSVSGKVGCFAEGVDVEGNGQIFVELENGVSAVATHCGYSKVREFQTEYIFTGGIIKTSFDRHITVQLGEKVWEEDIPGSDTFKRQLEAFAESITEGRDTVNSGEYGLEIIKAVTSLY